jgi:hypothetical protein
MERNIICQGYLTLTEEAPFGVNTLNFKLDEKLYEVEVRHDPVTRGGEIVEGQRLLAVTVKRIG